MTEISILLVASFGCLHNTIGAQKRCVSSEVYVCNGTCLYGDMFVTNRIYLSFI